MSRRNDTVASSEWTGRKPRFPLFAAHLAVPWFAIEIGHRLETNSYGCTVWWGRNHRPAWGELRYLHWRTWTWATAKEVMEASN